MKLILNRHYPIKLSSFFKKNVFCRYKIRIWGTLNKNLEFVLYYFCCTLFPFFFFSLKSYSTKMPKLRLNKMWNMATLRNVITNYDTWRWSNITCSIIRRLVTCREYYFNKTQDRLFACLYFLQSFVMQLVLIFSTF